jgi:hypothetical protein
MARLINSGVVSVLRNEKGGKPGTTRHYRLHINRLTTGDILTPLIDGTGDTGVVGRVTSATETGDTHVTQTIKYPPIKPSNQADEFCFEEILPSKWHDEGVAAGITDEQIYKSWRKFKDHTSLPFRLTNWRGWLKRERIRTVH